MPALCVLLYLAAALLGASARLAAAAASAASAAAAGAAAAAGGPVVRCEPCDAAALLQCRPLPEDCAERVREPGCGCCTTCALGDGRPCGVYTGRCGAGLTCRHRPGESRPLQALLEGRGVCSGGGGGGGGAAAAAHQLGGVLVPPMKQGASGSVDGGHGRGSLHTKLIRKEQSRKSQSYKVETVSGGANTDMHNFSLENKRETEYGPCRREMESILNSLKISNVLNPRGFRIPNCDKKGFYKKKQCRPSKGRKRGYCWCVDKYGQPLPGYDGKERGETQCYSLESI